AVIVVRCAGWHEELRHTNGGSGRPRRCGCAQLGRIWHSRFSDQLRRGRTQQAIRQIRGGKSTQGVGYFSGPCTPPGTPHHYTFVVIATDLDPKELPAGLTREEFLAKLAPPAPAPSHAKGAAGLVGLFVKPQ